MSEAFDWDPPTHYNFARDAIDRLARERPGDRAMLWTDGAGTVVDRSFAELSDHAAHAAAVLKAAGVGRGDTVLILMSREIEWWELMLACLRIGAIASPGTVQLTPKDIAYRCEAANARCIVAGVDVAPRVDETPVDAAIPLIHIGGGRPGWIDYGAAKANVAPLADIADTAFDDPALCYFTSGTTGQPKMTIHGAGYPLAHEITGRFWLDLGPGDLHWNMSDTGWAKAAWSSLFAPWLMGAAIFVNHAPGFDPVAAMDLLERYPVTTLCAPPTAYRMFVRADLDGRKFQYLRHCVSAGEPLNPEVIDLWKKATGLDIHDGYGQTETVLLCCNRKGAARQGAMGRPTPGIDLAVIGHDGEILPPDEEGDIALRVGNGRPPGLFLGYRGDPDRTASVYRNGWYLTGDRATVDADGFFWFVGRADDVILSSGYRIGPFEVESVLFEHEAVAESAVVASPDPTRGEVVKAFVVLAAGHSPSDDLAKALQDHVKAITAPYKYPRRIEFVDSLPKTVSGKIRRKELRDEEFRDWGIQESGRMTDSYVRGRDSGALIEMTIGDLFDCAALRDPDGEALVVRHQHVRWTWGELKARVDAVAAGLIARGLKPGERVGIWAPNCAEWAVVQFATAKAGLILVNINPAYRIAELDYALNKVGCAALILAPSHKSSDYVAMLGEIAPEIAGSPPGSLRAARLPDLRLVVTLGAVEHPGCLPFAALASDETSALADIRLDPDMPVNIQFTSGTTGFPKGATLSHRNIVNNGASVGARIGLTAADRLCIPVPLYHCFGMVMGNLACVVHGATMVYPAEAFDPQAVLQTIEAERCTALYGVPTMFIAALGHPEFDRFDLSSLRTGIMAGSPCPMAVMREVIDRMHMEQVTIAYGMTETSPVSFQSDTDDPLDLRVSTVGRVQPHLEVKLIDLGGNIVSRGQTGELCTRGYSVMLGYWDDAERTADAIDAEGWMHTGDLATIDQAGYCRIVGRIKDMVIRGGENIYPREVEEYLLTHPDIVDVQGVGIPDERYGEELCVWIVLRAGAALNEEQVRAHCRGHIAHFKIPRHIVFVDDFPMTVTGKVQKFAMREQTIRLLKERAGDVASAG